MRLSCLPQPLIFHQTDASNINSGRYWRTYKAFEQKTPLLMPKDWKHIFHSDFLYNFLCTLISYLTTLRCVFYKSVVIYLRHLNKVRYVFNNHYYTSNKYFYGTYIYLEILTQSTGKSNKYIKKYKINPEQVIVSRVGTLKLGIIYVCKYFNDYF